MDKFHARTMLEFRPIARGAVRDNLDGYRIAFPDETSSGTIEGTTKWYAG